MGVAATEAHGLRVPGVGRVLAGPRTRAAINSRAQVGVYADRRRYAAQMLEGDVVGGKPVALPQ